MPSVRYYNQTAPFWDFVANLEDQGSSHPFFGGSHPRGVEQHAEGEGSNPWQGFWPFGGMPHRGRHGQYPAAPPPPNNEHAPPPAGDEETGPAPPEYEDPEDGEAGPSEPKGPRNHHDRRHSHGHGHGPGPYRGPWGGRRGGFGGRGRGGHCSGRRGFGMGGPSFNNFGPLGAMFQSQMFGNDADNAEKSEDFKPEVDVFDTAETFVVHISLPGAKKEDVGVSWDADKSELSIAGVVYRPGDEELLKSLALDERKVGAFERKVRLGSRANPAQVEVDGITAKLEDGVLRVEVPKLDSGYVEVKKVDIE